MRQKEKFLKYVRKLFFFWKKNNEFFENLIFFQNQ